MNRKSGFCFNKSVAAKFKKSQSLLSGSMDPPAPGEHCPASDTRFADTPRDVGLVGDGRGKRERGKIVIKFKYKTCPETVVAVVDDYDRYVTEGQDGRTLDG